MKHASLLLIFLIYSCSSISGGNTGSDQNAKSTPKADARVEKAIKEMNNYLSKIVHTSKTRPEFDEHLKSLINRDVPDPKVFPALNALMSDEANQNDQEFLSLLSNAVGVSLKNHIESKYKELKLP